MFMQIAAAVAIIGGWAPEGSYCASGEAYVFSADGTFGNEAAEGRWTQRRNALTLDIGGMRSTLRIQKEDEATIRMKWPDGRVLRWRRCGGNDEPWIGDAGSQ